MATWKTRLSRLERYAFPLIGQENVKTIKASQIRAVLDGCAKDGKSRQTVVHLKNDLNSVFKSLWQDEIIENNPMERVAMLKMEKDPRQRSILTDAEFVQFMRHPNVATRIKLMALVSRCIGGMRTSEINNWQWDHIDNDFCSTHIYRSKTKTITSITIPDKVSKMLYKWWMECGKPAFGPVFPVEFGARVGQSKRLVSYASRLRKELWKAGVRRHELHFNTDRTLRIDFHSFRRAYVTALANSGVNAQTAMLLAGHKQMSTHMRYVQKAEVISVPNQAIPDGL